MKHILSIIFLIPTLAVSQNHNFLVGGDISFPMGQYRNLAQTGAGIFLMYERKSSSYAEIEYLDFSEKKIYNSTLWLSTKISMFNFRVGQKFTLSENGFFRRIYISGEIGTSTMYLNGDSNFGIGTKTNETDLAYAPGLGYKFKKCTIWYTIQFIRVSGGLTSPSSTTNTTTIDFSSVKIAYTL